VVESIDLCIQGGLVSLLESRSEGCIPQIKLLTSQNMMDICTTVLFQTLSSGTRSIMHSKNYTVPTVLKFQTGRTVRNLKFERRSHAKILMEQNFPVVGGFNYGVDVDNSRC
jgi:hypothetical protein